MTDLLARPNAMAMAAEDLAGIGSGIDHARAAAASPITGMVPPAADEISAATTTVFNAFGAECQAVIEQAAVFHQEFTAALVTAGNAYVQAEFVNAKIVTDVSQVAQVSRVSGSPRTPFRFGTTPATAAQNVTLIMGGTGSPTPQPYFTTNVFDKYVAPNFHADNLGDARPLFTPEVAYPMDRSISQGLGILNSAVLQQTSSGNNVVVVGYSQSAVISSLEMQSLAATPNPPSSNQLSFVLLGDPMNPNGGLMARFPGLTMPNLGLDFYGATPTNTIYPTHIYTIQYDGFADFPRYPIDVLADLNAVAGIPWAHGQYANVSSALLATAITLPTDPAYGTATTYSIIPTGNLPLLEPVRAIPVIGNPLADLLQPDLTYLVNWGYGNPAYGYSAGPANVPTPFGLFPPLSDTLALGADLVTGTQQGFGAFARDVGAISLPSLSDIVDAFASAPAPTWRLPTGLDLVNAVNDATSGYASLLPAADFANGLLEKIPAYDVALFLQGVAQAASGDPAGLVNAIADPVTADVALAVLIGGVDGLAVLGAGPSILAGLSSLP